MLLVRDETLRELVQRDRDRRLQPDRQERILRHVMMVLRLDVFQRIRFLCEITFEIVVTVVMVVAVIVAVVMVAFVFRCVRGTVVCWA